MEPVLDVHDVPVNTHTPPLLLADAEPEASASIPLPSSAETMLTLPTPPLLIDTPTLS
jgi:hypothetical protein